jgi:peptide/nickel transport system permease protein
MASWIRGSAAPDSGPSLAGPAARAGAGLAARRVPLYVWASAVFMSAIILAALFAPTVSPYDPTQQSLRERLRGPTWFPEAGRYRHLLGTDQLGRDILSRIIYGSRVSLIVGFAAVIIGGTIGGTLGLISGYAGGAVDEAIMLVVDAQLAFPFILLAIGIIAVLGPSFPNLILVVGLSGWVTYARIVRAQVLTIKEREYITAIRGLGGSRWRIVLTHILPNTFSPFLVVATLELARTIILESTLSFLGLGIQPPTPSWGGMMSEGRSYLDTAWWISAFAGLVLMLTALVVSRVGDWLRDVLDPTLRGA